MLHSCMLTADCAVKLTFTPPIVLIGQIPLYNQQIFFHHITSASTCSNLVTVNMYKVHSSEVEHTKHNIWPENVWLVN